MIDGVEIQPVLERGAEEERPEGRVLVHAQDCGVVALQSRPMVGEGA